MSKHRPETRSEFKALILRRLGSPVITINVSDDQVEDAIEEALKYFMDYHYDGSEHVYYAHTATQDDIDNGWIPIPDNIFGINEVYSANLSTYTLSAGNMFNGGYQMALDFAFNMSTGSLVSFYLAKTNYELMNQLLIGQTPIRFSRHTNKLHIDFNWNKIAVGDKIFMDAYRSLDQDTEGDMWNDRWLTKYATAKVKYIWGQTLSKIDNFQLPNGGTLNGTMIKDDAKEEIQLLEDEMISTYSIPPRDIIL